MKAYENNSGPVVKVLIVDDHHLLRDGLKSMLLSFRKEMEIEVNECDSGAKALQVISRQNIDLVIIDYKLEGMSGPETIQRILRFKPATKILALSNYSEYACIEEMTEAGALGYILKNVQPAQLLTAIKTVLAGKRYYCNEVSLVLISESENKPGTKDSAMYKVSARELEVLLLIAQGLTNLEIAEQLFLARRTVDKHRQNLLAKLKVKNTAALVRLAIEMNLIK